MSKIAISRMCRCEWIKFAYEFCHCITEPVGSYNAVWHLNHTDVIYVQSNNTNILNFQFLLHATEQFFAVAITNHLNHVNFNQI